MDDKGLELNRIIEDC